MTFYNNHFTQLSHSSVVRRTNYNFAEHRCRSKNIVWGTKDFCPNFPKLAQKVVGQIFPTVFWSDLQKVAFTCFSANVGRHCLKLINIGRHFCIDFPGFCLDIWEFCSDFQWFCTDFQHISTFGGAFAPPCTLPPTPLLPKYLLMIWPRTSRYTWTKLFGSLVACLTKQMKLVKTQGLRSKKTNTAFWFMSLVNICDNVGSWSLRCLRYCRMQVQPTLPITGRVFTYFCAETREDK